MHPLFWKVQRTQSSSVFRRVLFRWQNILRLFKFENLWNTVYYFHINLQLLPTPIYFSSASNSTKFVSFTVEIFFNTHDLKENRIRLRKFQNPMNPRRSRSRYIYCNWQIQISFAQFLNFTISPSMRYFASAYSTSSVDYIFLTKSRFSCTL